MSEGEGETRREVSSERDYPLGGGMKVVMYREDFSMGGEGVFSRRSFESMLQFGVRDGQVDKRSCLFLHGNKLTSVKEPEYLLLKSKRYLDIYKANVFLIKEIKLIDF